MPESGADTWRGKQSQASLPTREPFFVRFIGHSSPVALGNHPVGQVKHLKVARTRKGANIMGFIPTSRKWALGMSGAVALLAGACVSPAGPVEAVRFVSPDRAGELGRGPIRVTAGEGMDPTSLEFRSYAAAVERELERIGYQVLPVGAGSARDVQTALVRINRMVVAPGGPQRNPVSVGVGGGTGGFGSGLGVGIGLNLGGRPKDRIATELFADIRSGDGAVLWEGRAMVEAKAGSPMAETQLNASKLAEGLFTDFPGESGATIKVP